MTRLRACLAALLLAASAASADVRQLALPANDLVYDPGTQHIYASLPSSAGRIGNSITAIDPVTGQVGPSVFIGSEPDRLALSDDGQYLADDGCNAVGSFHRMIADAGGVTVQDSLADLLTGTSAGMRFDAGLIFGTSGRMFDPEAEELLGTLSAPAPAGGVQVLLASLGSRSSVPPAVTVPERTATATFSITVHAAPAGTAVLLTAQLGGVVRTAHLMIGPANHPVSGH